MSTMEPIADSAETSSKVEEVFAGVDYIRCTLARTADDWAVWVADMRLLVESVADEGYEWEVWSMEGYRGLRCGGCFVGTRDDGAMCQVSGHRANIHLDRVYRPDLHISRLDAQVTVRFKKEVKGLGRLAYKRAIGANDFLPEGRRRKIWQYTGNDKGHTVYIGSWHSEQYCYLYNKSVESGRVEYDRCWRYECRFKNNFAVRWAELFINRDEDRTDTIARCVEQFFLARGVDAPWRYKGAPITLPLFQELPSDAERKLKWLKEQVRPAMRWLREHGFEEEANEALYGGIPDAGNNDADIGA